MALRQYIAGALFVSVAVSTTRNRVVYDPYYHVLTEKKQKDLHIF